MVLSRDQNAGQNGIIQIGNKSFETLEQFKYLGTALGIRIPFTKKLRADLNQGMFSIIRGRIFCLPVRYPEV